MPKKLIAPSILSANFACLGEEVKKALNAGADWIHIDVMDNHYVPNLTFGPIICNALRDYGIKATFDVHLMVEPVDDLIVEFAKAGATHITIHPEATKHLDRSLQLIKQHGCRAGLAFNPSTSLNYLNHVIEQLDLILIMSVNPGFGGQTFIPSALEKIREARTRINEKKLVIDLAVDGGVCTDNIVEIAKAGANVFVAGSAIFKEKDYKAVIQKWKNLIEKE